MELDWGHNSMSDHGGAYQVMARHIIAWWGILHHGKARGKAYLVMAGHVNLACHTIMSARGGAYQVMAWHVISWWGISHLGKACHVVAGHVISSWGKSNKVVLSQIQIVAMWFLSSSIAMLPFSLIIKAWFIQYHL